MEQYSHVRPDTDTDTFIQIYILPGDMKPACCEYSWLEILEPGICKAKMNEEKWAEYWSLVAPCHCPIWRGVGTTETIAGALDPGGCMSSHGAGHWTPGHGQYFQFSWK